MEIMINDKKELTELLNKVDDEYIFIVELKEDKKNDSDRRERSGA